MTTFEPVPESDYTDTFATSNKAFAYPYPNLTSIPIRGNLANIGNITRQIAVEWPEFSWESVPGDASSRCFQKFVHDLSRVGYDDKGQIWSIICPQQGSCFDETICLNVEITVTGQRGWVDEKKRDLAADMSVEGKIWFSPSSLRHPHIIHLGKLFRHHGLPFPFNKAHAIRVATHEVDHANHELFPVRHGLSHRFDAPEFAQHPEAWTTGTIDVEIGAVHKVNHQVVDAFNQKVLDLFNMSSGNMLKEGNILTWNVWFTPPAYAITEEWRDHAKKWRDAIDADHGSPDGSVSTPAKYADGSLFKPEKDLSEELQDIIGMVESLI